MDSLLDGGEELYAGILCSKNRSVPPYSVYVGVPAAKTFPRFTDEEIREHERILAMRQGENL